MYLEIFVEAFLNVPSFIVLIRDKLEHSRVRRRLSHRRIRNFLHDTFLEFALVNQVNAVCKVDSTVLF